MEDLKTLRMKKKLLLIELSALEQKISLLEDESITATEELESESLQSQKNSMSNTSIHESVETKPIPEQTASGKETSNPLMAAALPKSILKENTTPIPLGKTSKLVNTTNSITGDLSNMTILTSNSKIKKDQELRPDYKKALAKSAENYYVIYEGPHTGIHTDWGVVETFLKVDKTTCKKFKSEASARLSLSLTKEAKDSTKKPLLRPKIQKIREAHRDQRFIVPKDVEEQVSTKPLKFEDFRQLWSKIRAAGPEDLIHEKFYSTDKKNKSLYNFLEGADAELIYNAFSAGLVDNIYPSANLQELKFFPRQMVESIKTFRKKVLKAKDEPIYIKIISSLPEWQQEIYYSPYHYMEVGLAKGKKEIPQSQAMEDIDLPSTEILQNLRITNLRRIAEKIIEIISGSRKKVNYASSHCIITSWSFKTCSDEDIEQASLFGIPFKDNTLEVSTNTKTVFCRQTSVLFEEHLCNYCKVDSPTKEGPSTEESLSSDNGSA